MTDPGNPNKDFAVQGVQSDAISSLAWSPSANVLVAGSWSNEVRCWQVQPNGQAIGKAAMSHEAPILCTAFHSDGVNVFTGSCDKTAKIWDLASQQSRQVAAHDAPIKCVQWVADTNMLVTGSWDRTLKCWDTRTNNAVGTVRLPERCYAMDVASPLLVVATANRFLLAYDARKLTEPLKQEESKLKFQQTCIAAFPDRTGFAVGSIEGRVSVNYIQDGQVPPKTFQFRCHRVGREVYAVNDIKFCARFGTHKFATAGSDGSFVFWNKDKRTKLHEFARCNQSITATAFNHDGTIYAYALSYDWSRGHAHRTKQASILMHGVQEKEFTEKDKR